MPSNKSPLETYGKKTVFTAQLRRERAIRRRRIILVVLILAVIALVAWLIYTKRIFG